MNQTINVAWNLPKERPEYCLRFVLYKMPDSNAAWTKTKLYLAGANTFPMPPRIPDSTYVNLLLIMCVLLLKSVLMNLH